MYRFKIIITVDCEIIIIIIIITNFHHYLCPKKRKENMSSSSVPPPERLAYVYPISTCVFILPLVFTVVYLQFAATRTEEEDFWKARPAYLTRLETLARGASLESPNYATLLSALCLVAFWVESLGSRVAYLASRVFFKKSVLLGACQIYTFLHVFELGTCMRICYRCRAAPVTYIRYAFGTLLGGYTQRVALEEEARQYLKREKRRLDRMTEWRRKQK